jgi:hypothetical protein
MIMFDILGLVAKPTEQGSTFHITIKVTLISSAIIMGQNKYTTTPYMHVFVQSLGSVPSLIGRHVCG